MSERGAVLSRLEAVVLGLLVDEPAHGYALKARLAPGLPRERQINDGVLYPLLTRLERRGLASSRERPAPGPGRPRRVFRVTAAGRREHLAWLRSDRDEGPPLSHEMFIDHPLVKLLFADHLPAPERRAKVVAIRDAARARLQALDALAPAPPPARDSSGTDMAAGATILALGRDRERALIEALDDHLSREEAASGEAG